MRHVIFVEGVQMTDAEIEHLQAAGIEVRRDKTGIKLRPAESNWQPKTITGLLDRQTNDFVGFVLSEPEDRETRRTVRLIRWSQEE